jgi:transglutaminase-like putative cysteine protease
MTFDVPVDVPLGDPRQVESLTLELSHLEDIPVPQTSTQRVRRQPKGIVVVEISRRPASAGPKPLTEAEKAAFLSPTPGVQSDDPKLRALAAEIVGSVSGPREKAARINSWVHSHLKQTYQANATTALEVLDSRAGDCTEHTLLFITLCRTAGVPARELGGLAYDESQVVKAAGRQPVRRGTFNWHAWAEVYDGRQWVSMDPTWNEVDVDATHLVLSIGPEDFAWLNVLGKMKIRVLKFARVGP